MPQRIKTETAVVACHDAVYNGRNAAAAASSGATKKKKERLLQVYKPFIPCFRPWPCPQKRQLHS